MQEQDSEDPTGVSDADGRTNHTSLNKARRRKAKGALALKLAGATWEEICRAQGYPTERTAKVAVEQALTLELDQVDRDRMRALAGMRLERLLRSVWVKAIDDNHPEHLLAMTKAREVIADHRRLFGLDAPTEVIVHQPTRTELEQWVAQVYKDSTPRVIEEAIIDVDWEDEPPALEGAG